MLNALTSQIAPIVDWRKLEAEKGESLDSPKGARHALVLHAFTEEV